MRFNFRSNSPILNIFSSYEPLRHSGSDSGFENPDKTGSAAQKPVFISGSHFRFCQIDYNFIIFGPILKISFAYEPLQHFWKISGLEKPDKTGSEVPKPVLFSGFYQNGRNFYIFGPIHKISFSYELLGHCLYLLF